MKWNISFFFNNCLIFRHGFPKFHNQAQATLSIFEWIESWYNKRRRHSALAYKTIDEFKKMNNFINAA